MHVPKAVGDSDSVATASKSTRFRQIREAWLVSGLSYKGPQSLRLAVSGLGGGGLSTDGGRHRLAGMLPGTPSQSHSSDLLQR